MDAMFGIFKFHNRKINIWSTDHTKLKVALGH